MARFHLLYAIAPFLRFFPLFQSVFNQGIVNKAENQILISLLPTSNSMANWKINTCNTAAHFYAVWIPTKGWAETDIQLR